MRRNRVMHYCNIGYPVPQDAVMVSGPIIGYGCATATRSHARGGMVEASPFVAFVTCKACRRAITPTEGQP